MKEKSDLMKNYYVKSAVNVDRVVKLNDNDASIFAPVIETDMRNMPLNDFMEKTMAEIEARSKKVLEKPVEFR